MKFKTCFITLLLFCFLLLSNFIGSQVIINGEPIQINQINANLLNKFVDINLKILEADDILSVRTQEGNVEKSWMLVGSDGIDFISIKALGNLGVQRLQESLGQDFIRKIFAFSRFKVAHGRAVYWGVPFKLELVDESTVQANVLLQDHWDMESQSEEPITSTVAELSATEDSNSNPLREIDQNAEDDELVDVNLKILALNATFIGRKAETGGNQRVMTVIGSDGTDFVTIRAWGDKDLQRMQDKLGKAFLGKTFALGKFRVSFFNSENSKYNYGNVGFALHMAGEKSDIRKIKPSNKLIESVTSDSYHQHMLIERAVSPATFKPATSPVQYQPGEKIDLLAKIVYIHPIKREDELLNTQVLIIMCRSMDSFQLVRLSAWNIMADFLSQILAGRKGITAKFQDLVHRYPKDDSDRNIQLVFVNSSRITLLPHQQAIAQQGVPLKIGSNYTAESSSAMDKSVAIAGTGGPRLTSNPLKSIKSGDNFIDLIHLYIVATDEIRTEKAADGHLRPVWLLIGTDGTDFVNIKAWSDKNVNYFKEILGTKNNDKNTFVLEHIGKSRFALEHFKVLHKEKEYNYGSVEFELKMVDKSCIYLLYEPSQGQNNIVNAAAADNINAYFRFLRARKTVSNGFMETPPQQMQNEGTKINLVGKLIEVRGPTAHNAAPNSRVADIILLSVREHRFISMSAWDIMADFLVNILQGKLGTIVQLESVLVKNNRQEGHIINLVFRNYSRISMPSFPSIAQPRDRSDGNFRQQLAETSTFKDKMKATDESSANKLSDETKAVVNYLSALIGSTGEASAHQSSDDGSQTESILDNKSRILAQGTAQQRQQQKQHPPLHQQTVQEQQYQDSFPSLQQAAVKQQKPRHTSLQQTVQQVHAVQPEPQQRPQLQQQQLRLSSHQQTVLQHQMPPSFHQNLHQQQQPYYHHGMQNHYYDPISNYYVPYNHPNQPYNQHQLQQLYQQQQQQQGFVPLQQQQPNPYYDAYLGQWGVGGNQGGGGQQAMYYYGGGLVDGNRYEQQPLQQHQQWNAQQQQQDQYRGAGAQHYGYHSCHKLYHITNWCQVSTIPDTSSSQNFRNDRTEHHGH